MPKAACRLSTESSLQIPNWWQVFHKRVHPQMDGLQWKIPIKMDDLEVSLFQETCTYIYMYIYLT